MKIPQDLGSPEIKVIFNKGRGLVLNQSLGRIRFTPKQVEELKKILNEG